MKKEWKVPEVDELDLTSTACTNFVPMPCVGPQPTAWRGSNGCGWNKKPGKKPGYNYSCNPNPCYEKGAQKCGGGSSTVEDPTELLS